MIFFKDCTSIEELKKEYKRLALLNHPDKGGDTAIMQEINNQYQALLKRGFINAKTDKTEQGTEADIIYPEIIDQLIFLEGIVIEIIGRWVWVSGNTYPHKQKLKELHFLFSKAKTMWYFRPDESKTYNPKPWSIDEIRAYYGSDKVEGKEQQKIA